MQEHVFPAEHIFISKWGEGDRWQPTLSSKKLKVKARKADLWNLFLPDQPGA
jgi:acyl-CoA dehydrogenase